MASTEQHVRAAKSRARTILAAVVAGVLWTAQLLPQVIPQVNQLLGPKAQHTLAILAGIVTTVAAFLAKDSGASQIPSKDEPNAPPKESTS